MPQTYASLLPRRGERAVLRPWRETDIDQLRIWNMPGHRWQTLNGPYLGEATEEEADALAERLRTRVAEGKVDGAGRFLPIGAADEEERLLGTVSRYLVDETGWSAAGIVLYDPLTWGQGIGTEALGLWVDLLFRVEPELHRLDLRTWSGNVGMMKVAERLGFTLEARFREARLVDGQRYDSVGYGLLREEWARSSSADRAGL